MIKHEVEMIVGGEDGFEEADRGPFILLLLLESITLHHITQILKRGMLDYSKHSKCLFPGRRDLYGASDILRLSILDSHAERRTAAKSRVEAAERFCCHGG